MLLVLGGPADAGDTECFPDNLLAHWVCPHFLHAPAAARTFRELGFMQRANYNKGDYASGL